MYIVSLTLIKLDGDVVEEFVRHTSRFVDELIVCDMSIDCGSEILGRLRDEGLPITITYAGPNDIIGPDHSLRVRQAFELTDADYVLPLDADEFLVVDSHADLEARLSKLPPEAYSRVPWTSYVPTPADDLDEPRLLARIRNRRLIETRPYYKSIVARSFAGDPSARIAIGAHEIEIAGGVLESPILDDLRIAHFPVRSLAQIRAKALLGWCSIVALGVEDHLELGHQYRGLFDKLRSSPNEWDISELYNAGLNYLGPGAVSDELVYDPIFPVERRFEGRVPNLIEVMAAHVRILSRAYRDLRPAGSLT
jgi:hypothetical protein